MRLHIRHFVFLRTCILFARPSLALAAAFAWHALPCLALPWHVVPWPCIALPCLGLAMPWPLHALRCHAVPRLAPRRAMPGLACLGIALPCRALPCLAPRHALALPQSRHFEKVRLLEVWDGLAWHAYPCTQPARIMHEACAQRAGSLLILSTEFFKNLSCHGLHAGCRHAARSLPACCAQPAASVDRIVRNLVMPWLARRLLPIQGIQRQ